MALTTSRRTVCLGFLAVSAVALTGCGGAAEPEDRAVEIYKLILEGDASAVMDNIDLGEASPGSAPKEFVEKKISATVREAKTEADREGGVKAVEIYERASPEGLKSGFVGVQIKITFNNGTVRKERMKLRKTGDDWKMAI